MIPLTKQEELIHREQKKCYICKNRFSTDDAKKILSNGKIIVTVLENTEVVLIITAI